MKNWGQKKSVAFIILFSLELFIIVDGLRINIKTL